MPAVVRFSVEEDVVVRSTSTGEALMSDWAVEASIVHGQTRRLALLALRDKINEELAQ